MNLQAVKDVYDIEDDALAAIARNGDKDAFNMLVNRFNPRIKAFLFKRVSNRSDVEDIVQETFLKAYLNIASYNCDYKFSCWIFTIASRTAINLSRKQKDYACDFKQEVASDISRPEQIMIADEQEENLWTLARTLDEKQYSALFLRYAEDLSTEEIAKAMHTTKLNVRVILHRARNNLIKKTKSMR